MMLRSSLYDYSGVHILAKETMLFLNTETAAASNNRNVRLIFKNCCPFTGWLNKIKNI